MATGNGQNIITNLVIYEQVEFDQFENHIRNAPRQENELAAQSPPRRGQCLAHGDRLAFIFQVRTRNIGRIDFEGVRPTGTRLFVALLERVVQNPGAGPCSV